MCSAVGVGDLALRHSSSHTSREGREAMRRRLCPAYSLRESPRHAAIMSPAASRTKYRRASPVFLPANSDDRSFLSASGSFLSFNQHPDRGVVLATEHAHH